MAQQFLSGVKITAGDENTLYLNTGATGQEPAIFYQVNGSYKFEQRVGSNFELYNYTRSNWDFHLQGSTGYLALGHNSPGAGLHVKGTTNLASRFIFTKDLSTDKILFGGADHDNFDTFVGSSSNHSFTITQNGAAAITIDTSKNATFEGDVNLPSGNIIFGSQYGIRFNDANTRIYTNAETPEDLIIEADQDLLLQPDGRVGVGSIGNPNEKLHVEGTSRFNGDIHVGTSASGFTYRPQEGGSHLDRYFIMFDYTNNASYPFLTNRTPNGAVVIKTGTAAAGGENEHFRIKGGNGVVDAYFTNTNLGIGTDSPEFALHLAHNANSGGLNSGVMLEMRSSTATDPAGMRFVSQTGGSTNYMQNLYDGANLKWKHWSGSAYVDKITFSNAGNATFAGQASAKGLRVTTRGTASAETWNTSDGDGIFFDFYNGGNPYLRHGSIIANSADASAAQLEFYTTPASGSGTLALTLDSSQNATFAGDVTITGDLQVNGTTTTVNQTNLDVSDNIIGLNRGLTGTNANDSGIIIERGSSGDNAAFVWDESIGYFSFGTTQKTPSATGAVANESDWTWKPIKASGAVFTGDVSIPVAKKLYFGGGSHTYIGEDIDDRLRFFTGGTEFMRFTEDTSDIINFYTDATFAGNVTIGSTSTAATRSLTLQTSSEQNTVINLKEANVNYGFSLNYDGLANDFIIKRHDNSAGGINVLTLNRTDNNATFAGNVTLNSRLTFDYGGDHYFEAGTNSLSYKSSGGTSVMTLNASTQAATFAGTIASGNITVTGGGGGNGQVDITRTSGASIRLQSQSALAKFGTTTNHGVQFMTNDTGRWNIQADGDIVPVASTYDIGSSGGHKPANVYATNFHGDGSNLTNISATFNGGTVANATTFSSDITLDDNSGASPSLYLTNGDNNYWRIFNGSSLDLTFRVGTVTKFDIDSSGNGTFVGTATAAKLISTGGVLDLDDNGDADGVINARASLTLNIDSDANSTGEVFRINSNTTGVNTNNLFNITEAGAATFAGDITTNGDIIIDNSSGDPFLKLKTSAQEWVVRIDQSDSEKFQIRNVTGTDTALSIDTSSNATFAGDVYIDTRLQFNGSSSAIRSNNEVKFLTTGNAAQVGRFKGIQVSSSYGGTVPTQGILFGTDTNLYRDSANVLKTDDSLIVAGDLTVQGTTVTIDTTNLNVEDKNITLNYGSGDTSANADGAGITIQDAVDASNDATILWDQTNSEFDFSHGATFVGTVQAPYITANNPSGAANGSAQEVARFVNTTSGATSSYMYIGASSGTDWRLGKNINGTASNTNFGITKHSGTAIALEIDSSLRTRLRSTDDYVLGLVDSGGTDQWWLKAYNSNGNFAIHENGVGDKFTIAAGGNATFAGDITVEGGDATIKKAGFPGGVLTLGREYSSSGDMTSALIQFQARNSNSTLRTFGKIEGRSNGYDGGSIYFYTENSGTETQALLIDENQNATFAGNVDIYTGAGSATLNIGRNSSEKLQIDQTDQETVLTANNDSDSNGTHNFRLNRVFAGTGANNFKIQKDGTDQLSIDTNANATFAGAVTVGPGTTGSPYDSTTFLHVKGTTRSIVQQSSTADAYYMFGDAAANNVGWVGYNHSSGNANIQAENTITLYKPTNVVGTFAASDDLTLDNSSPEIYFKTGSTHYNWMIAAQENIDTALEFTPANAVGASGTHNAPALTLYANRNATFAGSTTATGAVTVTNTSTGNANFYAGATGTGYAGLYIDAVNGDFAGGDYFSLRQLDDKAIEFNARSGTGNTLFYSKGSLNLTQDGANSTFAGDIKLADNNKIKGTTYSAGFISFESDGETRISANDDVVIGYGETLNISNTGVSTFAGAVTLAGTLTNNVAQASASVGNTVTLTKINSNNAYTEYTGFLSWTYSGTGSNPYTFNLVFDAGTLDVAYEVVLRTGRNGNWRNFGAMKDFGYIYNESDGDFKHSAEGDVTIASGLTGYEFSLDSDPVGFGAVADNNTSDTASSGTYSKFIRRYSFNFENNTTGSDGEWEIYVKVYNFAGDIKFLKA
jgi:hypothetical protein